MRKSSLLNLLRGAAFPGLLLGSLVAAMLLAQPPSPAPADINTGEFSAQRAMRHVHYMAQQPRPIGSIAHDVMRDYLVDELDNLGMVTEIQATTVSYLRSSRPGVSRFAWVRNVIGYWEGTGDGKALVLMAHYDSRPLTPGAGDDASGVATLLETVRALSSQQPFHNDVIVLLTDGEESGLFGAQAFFRNHPLRENVGTVLNFEARGSRGPALLFETNDGNADLVRIFAEHSLAPAGSSLADAVYKRMPNDTDFSIALENGHQGLNFAFVDGFFDYHSPTDTAENLSAASVQHVGAHALPLARHLADARLPVRSEGNRIFFNLAGRSLFVHYPPAVDTVAILIAIALLGVIGVRCIRGRLLTAMDLLRGTMANVVMVAVPVLAVAAAFAAFIGNPRADDVMRGLLANLDAWFATWTLMAVGIFHVLASRLRGGYSPWLATAVSLAILVGLIATGTPTLIAAGIALLLGVVTVLLLATPVPIIAQRAGALLLWMILAVAMLLAEPAGAYIFSWPLLLAAIVMTVIGITDNEPSPVYRLLMALPALLVLGFLAYFVNLALGYAQPAISMLVLALMAMWTAILFPAHWQDEWRWGGALLLVSLAMAPWLAFFSPFDASTPRPTEMFAVADRVGGQAYLASGDAELTPWQRDYFDSDGKRPAPPHWIGSGDMLWLEEIDIETTAGLVASPAVARNDGQSKTVRFHLRASGGISRGYLEFENGDSIDIATVDGEPIARPEMKGSEPWRWSWVGMPENGVMVELKLETGAPLPAIASTAFRDGLPDALRISPRPDDEMPDPYSWSDSTVVIERFQLQE